MCVVMVSGYRFNFVCLLTYWHIWIDLFAYFIFFCFTISFSQAPLYPVMLRCNIAWQPLLDCTLLSYSCPSLNKFGADPCGWDSPFPSMKHWTNGVMIARHAASPSPHCGFGEFVIEKQFASTRIPVANERATGSSCGRKHSATTAAPTHTYPTAEGENDSNSSPILLPVITISHHSDQKWAKVSISPGVCITHARTHTISNTAPHNL